MDERRYEVLLAEALRRIEDLFEEIDPDVVEATRAGDALTLAFSDGTKLIVTPQRPVQQLWVAARGAGYHFVWDLAASRWTEERGRAAGLMELIADECRAHAGVEIAK